MRLDPLQRGSGYVFENQASAESIPEQFISAIEQGVREQMASGISAGYPVVDVRVTLTGGSSHATDSSELAFRTASSVAFRDGCARAGAVLLEPVMKVEVNTPDAFLGEIGGDIVRRRGTLSGIGECANGKLLRAEVPLAGMFGYATALRSMTQGRATYSMVFGKYIEIPAAGLPVDE